MALEQAGQKHEHLQADQVVFFDDSLRNVRGASACGIRTVLVGTEGADTPAIAEIKSLHDLRAALPELWNLKATIVADPQLGAPAASNGVRALA